MTPPPLVLLSAPPTESTVDSDCACPDTPLWAAPTGPTGSAPHYQQAPMVHQSELAPGYSLAFNPLAQSRVAVLNASARALWASFATPQPWPTVETTTAATLAQLCEAQLLQPAGYQPERHAQPPHTLTAWLHVTNACNLRCDYCYVHKTADEMLAATGRRAVRAVFQTAQQRGFRAVKLKYAGGEATLNFPLVLELHALAQQLATETGLSLQGTVLSNGVGLTRPMLASIRQHKLNLMISLDGVGAAHDAQRHFANGRGSFALVDRSLRLARAEGVTPNLCITLTRRSLDTLPDAVAYALAQELPFNLNFYREADCAPEDLALDTPRVIAALRAALQVIEQHLPAERIIDRLLDRAQFDRPHQHACGVGQSYAVINHRGQVSACHMVMGQHTATLNQPDGDLLAWVAADPHIQNLSVDEKTGCRDCAWRYWCAGGCPLATYRATGRWDVQSPNCHIYQALYPELLRLEGLRLLKNAGLWAQPTLG